MPVKTDAIRTGGRLTKKPAPPAARRGAAERRAKEIRSRGQVIAAEVGDRWIDVRLAKLILGSGSTAAVRKMARYEGRFDGEWGCGWRQRPNGQLEYFAAGVLAYAGKDASEFPELLSAAVPA